MSVYKSNDNWFVLRYCGLLIKEKTAKKLQKLLWRQTQEIKELLIANKDDCVPGSWTLAYPEPEKKQTVVYYTCNDDTVDNIIKLFDKADRLSHVDNGVFVTDEKYNKASEDVKRFYEEMYGDAE